MNDNEQTDLPRDTDTDIDVDEMEMEMEEEMQEEVGPAWLEVPGFVRRLHRALGPLAGGLILDFLDLATFGPLGVAGFFVGALIGWWITSIYGFSTRAKLSWSIVAGIYCLVPFTEFIPVATIISAVARYKENPEGPDQESESADDPIDVAPIEPDDDPAEPESD